MLDRLQLGLDQRTGLGGLSIAQNHGERRHNDPLQQLFLNLQVCETVGIFAHRPQPIEALGGQAGAYRRSQAGRETSSRAPAAKACLGCVRSPNLSLGKHRFFRANRTTWRCAEPLRGRLDTTAIWREAQRTRHCAEARLELELYSDKGLTEALNFFDSFETRGINIDRRSTLVLPFAAPWRALR